MKIIGIPSEDYLKYGIHPLNTRRKVNALAMIYRMHLPSCPSFLSSILPPRFQPQYKSQRHTRSTSTPPMSHALDQLSLSAHHLRRNNGNRLKDHDQFKRCLLPFTINIWNSLPRDIVQNIPNNSTPQEDTKLVKQFKKRALKHLLSSS